MAAKNITNKQFHELISGDRPVLVDFWAPWCTYCMRIHSAYESIAGQYGNSMEVVKVNIDEEPELTETEQIEVIPTLVLYKNGKAVDSITAPDAKADIDAFIQKNIQKIENDPQTQRTVHDMVVIGGGPGGYTAALYAARAGLDIVLLEKLSAGGQMALTHQIDNYPGYKNGIAGLDLGEKMRQGAERFGAVTEIAEVLSVDFLASPKKIKTTEGTFYGRTVVFATGASPREMGLPMEKELVGRGVHYCASCDGMFYKDKTVVVVGGGNSAAADAMILSRIAKKVIIVHRRETLRATKIYHDPLMKAENIEFCWNCVTTELLYEEDRVTGVKLMNGKTGEEFAIACDGVFFSIGRAPATDLVRGQLELNRSEYIAADETTQTNIEGVYAVGDVRTKALRQVVTAVADGAVAVHYAEEYLNSLTKD